MAGYRDDTNSLRGKRRPGRITIIWPHQLGFVSVPESDTHTHIDSKRHGHTHRDSNSNSDRDA